MSAKRTLVTASHTLSVALLLAGAAACAGRSGSGDGMSRTPDPSGASNPVAMERARARLAAGDSGPFRAAEVEEPARARATGVFPRYPRELRETGVQGEVMVQFVVGADGRPVMPSVKVLRSSHMLFTEAVREVLPRLRFTPARLAGQPVAQVTQYPFTFSIQR